MKNYRKLMKTRTFIVGLLGLLSLPTFIACDDDDFTTTQTWQLSKMKMAA